MTKKTKQKKERNPEAKIWRKRYEVAAAERRVAIADFDDLVKDVVIRGDVHEQAQRLERLTEDLMAKLSPTSHSNDWFLMVIVRLGFQALDRIIMSAHARVPKKKRKAKKKPKKKAKTKKPAAATDVAAPA